MQEIQPSIFEETEVFMLPPRRALLPRWIIFFSWLFVVISPIQLILAFIPYYFDLSEYNIPVKTEVTFYSIAWYASALLTTIAAYGLLTEKSWAVNVAIIDVLLDIPKVIYEAKRVWPEHPQANYYYAFYGISLVLLIIFGWKLFRIRKDWSIRQPR